MGKKNRLENSGSQSVVPTHSISITCKLIKNSCSQAHPRPNQNQKVWGGAPLLWGVLMQVQG